MVTLDATVTREGGIALVELLVENTAAVARRVRIENRIDGPCWPPRTRGVPDEGWDESGVEIALDPGERRALGYASDGSVPDPPAEIATVERASPRADPGPEHADLPERIESSAAGVVRALTDPTPPADAVPVPDPESGGAADEGIGDRNENGDGRDLPPGVAAWLSSVEERTARIEALAAVPSVTDAARAVDDAGGLAAVEEELEELGRDRDSLRALETRVRSLRERGERASAAAPMDALRRLA